MGVFTCADVCTPPSGAARHLPQGRGWVRARLPAGWCCEDRPLKGGSRDSGWGCLPASRPTFGMSAAFSAGGFGSPCSRLVVMQAAPKCLLSMPASFHYSRSELVPRARKLRRDATFPERVLWSRLRRRQLGVRFLRQRPVGQYIIDFYCPDVGLAVEVDGRSHDGAFACDLQRQAVLEGLGLRVLRVANDAVLEDVDGVVAQIITALGQQSRPGSDGRSSRS